MFSCFISHIGVFFGLFLGPVLAIVCFNTVIFVIVLRVLIKHYLRKIDDIDNKKKVFGTFKTFLSVVSIMFMFGLQWLFGAFTIAQASEAFQWLFVIFSTLQGVFLFLYFCVLAQDAREHWLNLLTLGRRKLQRRSAALSRSSHSHARPNNQKHSSSSGLTTNPNYTSALKRNVLLAPPSSSSWTNSIGESSASEMASPRTALFALPNSITEEKETETEFVITNRNVSDRDDSESGMSEKVDLCTTITNTATAAEVPPHILERRFRFHHTPPATKEVEKVDPPITPRPIVMPKEPTVEVPPHVLERRRSSATFQKPAKINELSVLEETEEKDDNGEEWEIDDTASETNFYDANDFEFGDDFAQLLNMSTLTDGDFSDFEEMTSNL